MWNVDGEGPTLDGMIYEVLLEELTSELSSRWSEDTSHLKL